MGKDTTDYTELRLSRQADSSSASQEIVPILCNLEAHYINTSISTRHSTLLFFQTQHVSIRIWSSSGVAIHKSLKQGKQSKYSFTNLTNHVKYVLQSTSNSQWCVN